jgi:hypothetical protein
MWCDDGEGTAECGGKLLRVEAQIGQLRHFLPLAEKVIAQTRERVWGDQDHKFRNAAQTDARDKAKQRRNSRG